MNKTSAIGRKHLLRDVAAFQSLDGKHHFPESILGSISATYYSQGNLLYKSAEQYLRIFSPVFPGAGPESDAQGQARPITVSGKEARMFERERKEFLPMHRLIDPNDSPPRDAPRVYERRGEMMARAVPVRERFVVIPGKVGFYALRYSAEAKDFQEFLPDFEKLTATFEILE